MIEAGEAEEGGGGGVEAATTGKRKMIKTN